MLLNNHQQSFIVSILLFIPIINNFLQFLYILTINTLRFYHHYTQYAILLCTHPSYISTCLVRRTFVVCAMYFVLDLCLVTSLHPYRSQGDERPMSLFQVWTNNTCQLFKRKSGGSDKCCANLCIISNVKPLTGAFLRVFADQIRFHVNIGVVVFSFSRCCPPGVLADGRSRYFN